MSRFLPCPLPCHSEEHQQSDQPHNDKNLSSDSSSSSSRSLASQVSLPSVPSLTPHSQAFEHAASTAAARHHCVATLKGHSSYIFSLTLTGKHLYSGASNGEIRVWDRNPSPSSQSYVVSGNYSGIKSIAVLGDKLFTAHHDHKIRVWKIDNPTPPHRKYKLITTLPTVNDRCLSLFSAKNYVEIRRHKRRTWVHHVDTVSALALSRDGALIYSVSWDRSFKVWRTSDFKCLESFQHAHDDAINAVVLSDDGFLYTGSADKTIRIWKKPDGSNKHALVSTLEKHKSAVNALALSNDGSVLYSGACDRSIIVWEKDAAGYGAAHFSVAGALRGHKKAILCLAVVADLLCSGSADKTVRIWRRSGNSYSCLAVFEGHNGPVKCLTATLDNNNNSYNNHDNGNNNRNNCGNSYLIYSGSLDFDIRVWKLWVPI